MSYSWEKVQEIQAPKVLQLTKNFRSHSKILDLANSVVSLVELLFPKTIDKLMKERSDLDGPKPILIEPTSTDYLRQLLGKYQLFEDSSKVDPNGAISGAQFGCDRVVIVRD